MYLENAWCLVHEILHQTIVIQGNLVGAPFNGLLAELPIILDSFFSSTTSDYIGVVGRGWWGATKWQGKHSYTCTMDPLSLEIAQKVVKSVDNITTRLWETLQHGSLCLTKPAVMTEYKPGIHRCLTCLRKQPQEKQTGGLLSTIHANMDFLIMHP